MATQTFAPIVHRGSATIEQREDGTVCIKGVPGGTQDEPDGIVLVRPVKGHEEGEVYEDKIHGQSYWRSWGRDRILKGTPAFPQGIEVGLVNYHTDTGTGVPFVERSVWQITDDAYARLAAYANRRPYMSMKERREYALATEQYINEKGAGAVRSTTTTPSDALKEIAAQRQAPAVDIDALVQKAVADALAKQAAPQPKRLGRPPKNSIDPTVSIEDGE